MSLKVGQIIEGYRIASEIGRGGNGVVFKAMQSEENQVVALKTPWKERIKKNPGLVDNFLREASAIGRLEHPNIARYYKAGTYRFEENGEYVSLPYLTMELVEGTPLSEMNRSSVRKIVLIMQKIVEAVAYAHAKGVIHKDLKPTNIILDKNGSPKILDFGLARLMDEIVSPSSVFEGSPSYAAPEQFKGEPCDERTDIWTLGAILFDLLTGRPPFIPSNPEQLNDMQKVFVIQEQVLNQTTPSPSNFCQEVDPYLDEICIKCLSKDRKDRYQNAEDMVSALRKWGRLNRDEWTEKARRCMKMRWFFPSFLRNTRILKAYRYIEKGLSYDAATPPIKEDILNLFSLQGFSNLAIVEMPLPDGLTPEQWEAWRKNIDKISLLDCPDLVAVKKIVVGMADGEVIPHQVLALYEVPKGKNLRSQIALIPGDVAIDLAYRIVSVITMLEQHGLSPTVPEVQDIFIQPVQIVATGWAFRKDKEINALHLANLLYYVLTGLNLDPKSPDVHKLPEKFKDVLLEILKPESPIKSVQNFVDALGRNQEARKILDSGVLDRPFDFPPGEYYVSKTLVIEKNGHLRLQGKSVFRMEEGTGIECQGQITAKGEWDVSQGQGSISFLPSKIKEGWKGIHILPGNDKTHAFKGCVFEGGRGSLEESGGICGGAINLEGGKLEIEKSIFKDNRAETDGGAIYVGGKNAFEVKMAEVIFVQNSSDRHGGAVAANGPGKMTLQECRFEDNRAQEEGGSLYAKGENSQFLEVSAQNCTFNGNKGQISGGSVSLSFYVRYASVGCQYDNNVTDDSGGAISIVGKGEESSEARLENCKFTGNKSQIRGGAIVAKKYTSLFCKDCRFDGNSSDRDSGGSIALDGKGASVPTRASFIQTIFTENRCRIDGGAVNSNLNTDIRFEDCRFEGNAAEDNSGGAVVVVGESGTHFSVCAFVRCTFNRNRCKMDGGAINANLYTRTSYEDCRFKSNSADDSGGAFQIVGEEGEKSSEATFKQTVFSGNRSRTTGGALDSLDATSLLLDACQFENNRSEEDGGAIQIKGTDCGKYSEAIFSNCIFKENRSKQSAGALNLNVFTRSKFQDCDFKSNQAEGKHGGAIQISGKDGKNATEVTLSHVTFSENICKMDGGALHCGDYSLVILDKARFERNKSENSGGAVSLVGREDQYPSKITFRGSYFLENHSNLDGGAVAAGFNTRMIVSDCQFVNNSADSNCGAIGISGKPDAEASKAKFTNVVFSNNHCKADGGAVASGTHSQMIFEECHFENNWSESTCGAIGVAGKDKKNLSDATFTKVHFVGNHCSIDGGAMVVGRYSRAKFDQCLFERNYVEEKTGGAVLILGRESGFVTIADFNGVIFRENHCRIDGGAINANIYSQVSFKNCLFEKNIAKEKNGGAIVLLGKDGNCQTKAIFHNVVFRQNQCKVSGGAINANDYTRSHFVECTFEENRAIKKNGGAILVLGEDGRYPSEAKFVKVKFRRNYCLGSGGAVNANVFTISHFEACLLEKNVAEENGGGILIRGLRRMPNKAVITGCHFLGNIAGNIGADVALNAVKGVTEHSLIHDNTIEIPEPDFQAEEIEEKRNSRRLKKAEDENTGRLPKS